MVAVVALLTLATIALGFSIYIQWGAWGRRQVRAGVRERARVPAKKPRAVRLYCPACGTQAIFQQSGRYKRHDIIVHPWCPCCRVWVKQPVKIKNEEGDTT